MSYNTTIATQTTSTPYYLPSTTTINTLTTTTTNAINTTNLTSIITQTLIYQILLLMLIL